MPRGDPARLSPRERARHGLRATRRPTKSGHNRNRPYTFQARPQATYPHIHRQLPTALHTQPQAGRPAAIPGVATPLYLASVNLTESRIPTPQERRRVWAWWGGGRKSKKPAPDPTHGDRHAASNPGQPTPAAARGSRRPLQSPQAAISPKKRRRPRFQGYCSLGETIPGGVSSPWKACNETTCGVL